MIEAVLTPHHSPALPRSVIGLDRHVETVSKMIKSHCNGRSASSLAEDLEWMHVCLREATSSSAFKRGFEITRARAATVSRAKPQHLLLQPSDDFNYFGASEDVIQKMKEEGGKTGFGKSDHVTLAKLQHDIEQLEYLVALTDSI